jgi:hypothetical protein
MSAVSLEISLSWDGRPLAPQAVARVALEMTRVGLLIKVVAPFYGDHPPQGVAGPTDRLWNHEVVELFVKGPGPAYTEIELGPHGHHLVLRLNDVRQLRDSLHPIDFVATRRGPRWHGRALVPTALLPPLPWTGNAYAIAGVGAGRRYMAWAPVPGLSPDFHQPEWFQPIILPDAT